ncbi:unnamed protein product [Periconia digitata]|uniref:DUF1763-domain-containing protein n=1 Tax=Periconia digitata TaxID=1303443 RepID=A0A9W4XHX3_9PLEO|nr:unnamed protein product [Periconia digitata]
MFVRWDSRRPNHDQPHLRILLPLLHLPKVMSSQDIVHGYRHLYRHGLRAVQFSKPARYVLRDRLRLAFRKPTQKNEYNPQRIQNTIEFLQYATTHSGLEHKVLKNLLQVWRCQALGGKAKPTGKTPIRDELRINSTAYDAFNHHIDLLNESMEMCIPATTVRDPRF